MFLLARRISISPPLKIDFKIYSFPEKQRPLYKEYRRLAHISNVLDAKIIKEHIDEVD